MLTDQQLTETALRFLLTHLTDPLDPAFEMDDALDRLACKHHCPQGCDFPGSGNCGRTEKEWERERQAMRTAITSAVDHLRDELHRIAAVRGVTLPTT